MTTEYNYVLSTEEKQFAEDNIGLVLDVVRRKFNQTPLEFAELIQIGYFGLLSATHYYLLRKPRCKFSTFAVPRIIRKLTIALRKPSFNIDQFKNLVYMEEGRQLSDEDFYAITNIKELPYEKPSEFDDRLSPLDLLILKEEHEIKLAKKIKKFRKLRLQVNSFSAE